MLLKHYFIYSLLGIFPVNNENVNREYAILFILQKKIFWSLVLAMTLNPFLAKSCYPKISFRITESSLITVDNIWRFGEAAVFSFKILKNSNMGNCAKISWDTDMEVFSQFWKIHCIFFQVFFSLFSVVDLIVMLHNWAESPNAY